MKPLLAIERGIDRVTAVAGRCAAWCTLLLVLLTVEQVVARYWFQSSSVALQELEWHLFGLIFLLAAAQALRDDAHVRVDILYSRFSPRVQAGINVAGTLLFLLPTCGILLFYGGLFVSQAFTYQSPIAPDHWTAAAFAPDSWAYRVGAPVETALRRTVLLGEVSPDPGGLPARWLIRAAIPTAALLLGLQGLAVLIRQARILAGGEPGDTPQSREGV